MSNLGIQLLSSLFNKALTISPLKVPCSNLHTSLAALAWSKDSTPQRWNYRNKVVFPPQKENEERRPAFVCHQKTNIKYSPKKMWYVASFIRGMTIDEAIKQLSFVRLKGAAFVKETLLEAQEMAINNHNVEFKSNLWVAESFNTKGIVIKGIRRHARRRTGEITYRYTHYFVKLEEGTPPEDYYGKKPPPPEKLLENWVDEMRKRKITNTL